MILENTSIYVISRRNAEYRRANTDIQMKTANLDFHYFDALPADELSKDYHAALHKTKFLACNGRPHQLTEVACFASHRELWRLCARQNRNFFVLEDDFSFIDETLPTLPVIAKLPDSFQYIRLEGTKRKPARRIKTTTNVELVRYLKIPQRTTGYRITPGGAKALLEKSQSIYLPVDVFVRQVHIHEVGIYGLRKPVIGHSGNSIPSDIGDRKKVRGPAWARATRIAYKTSSAIYNGVRQIMLEIGR